MRNATRLTIFAIAPILLATAGCSRINSPVRASSAAPSVEFVDQWGTKGDAPGQLDDPVGIETDTRTEGSGSAWNYMEKAFLSSASGLHGG
jgi:hypothetical protein